MDIGCQSSYKFYKWVTKQIYARQIIFSLVVLKIRVNRPIMKLLLKKTLSLLICRFFTMIKLFSELYKQF